MHWLETPDNRDRNPEGAPKLFYGNDSAQTTASDYNGSSINTRQAMTISPAFNFGDNMNYMEVHHV
tara:strand:- start:16 stop:213 length:198 start_codon:yes stop_codon:yes gene_type:complete